MKNLNEIIKEGYEIKNKCYKYSEYVGGYISGEEYETWIMYCIRYLQQLYPNDPQTKKFSEIGQKANGFDEGRFDSLIEILKAFKDIPENNAKEENIDLLLNCIFTNFHRCVKSILNRHDNRPTLEIKDEYDVQDLLQGILRLFIDDLRPEDCVPSYAGKNSRTDFFLPKYEMYIETKMTRRNLTDKEIGDELCIDIARYGEQCKKLVCFIYDKENLLKNPYGLIKDLEKLSSDRIEIKVYITPL